MGFGIWIPESIYCTYVFVLCVYNKFPDTGGGLSSNSISWKGVDRVESNVAPDEDHADRIFAHGTYVRPPTSTYIGSLRISLIATLLHIRTMTEPSSFLVSAPGRLCLFGEHQDYLNMPVIALSLPLCCHIHVKPTRASRLLIIRVPTLNETWKYDLDNLPPRQGEGLLTINADFQPDFALASIYEALDDGWAFGAGAECDSTTDIPLQAGCSSSSAFCVAWSLVIAKLCGKDQELLNDPILLAKRAHRAEVTHFGAPGGTMDHVTSAVGGLLRIGPDPWGVERLSMTESSKDSCWVLAFSGEPKNTFGHLFRCKNARLALLNKLDGNWDADTTDMDLTEDEKILLSATLINRDMEDQAATAWRDGSATSESQGTKMKRHHEVLRDALNLSTNKLETLHTASMQAGAFGFKVVGSGGGGCGVAWTNRERATQVARAMQEAGAPQTWIIEGPSKGATLTGLK